MDGRVVVTYETDTDLRDTEQIPLREAGGIEASSSREVLPYVPDAWIDGRTGRGGGVMETTETMLRPYPKYKESGTGWLGNLPAHWEVRRLRYLLNEIDDRSETGKEELLSVSKYEGVRPREKKDDGSAQNEGVLPCRTQEGHRG